MNSGQKWSISLALGLLFVVISLPWTYEATNYIFKNLRLNTISSLDSNLTIAGIVIHFIVFTLLARLILVFYN